MCEAAANGDVDAQILAVALQLDRDRGLAPRGHNMQSGLEGPSDFILLVLCILDLPGNQRTKTRWLSKAPAALVLAYVPLMQS